MEDFLGSVPLPGFPHCFTSLQLGLLPHVDTPESLFDIIGSSTAESFRALVKKRPEIVRTPVGQYSELPIHFAAWQNRDDIIEVLLDEGAEIDAPGEGGQTALHYAAREGCLAAAMVLISRGANVNALDERNFTPAFYGVRGREDESVMIARRLVDAGAKVDLNLAVCLYDVKRVEDTLKQDPSAIQKCPFPNDLVLDAVHSIETAVFEQLPSDDYDDPKRYLSAVRANDRILRLLLDNGAPIDTPEFGWSPLFQSCQMKHPYVTQLLLEGGADPNVKYHGHDLRYVLIGTPCPDEMLQLLTENGFKPTDESS